MLEFFWVLIFQIRFHDFRQKSCFLIFLLMVEKGQDVFFSFKNRAGHIFHFYKKKRGTFFALNGPLPGVCPGEKLSLFSDFSQNSTLEKRTFHKNQCDKNGPFTKFNMRKTDCSQNSLPEKRTHHKI